MFNIVIYFQQKRKKRNREFARREIKKLVERYFDNAVYQKTGENVKDNDLIALAMLIVENHPDKKLEIFALLSYLSNE